MRRLLRPDRALKALPKASTDTDATRADLSANDVAFLLPDEFEPRCIGSQEARLNEPGPLREATASCLARCA